MNLDNDYDNDGNNIVPCPICLNVYCPSKEGGKCPEEDEFAKEVLKENPPSNLGDEVTRTLTEQIISILPEEMEFDEHKCGEALCPHYPRSDSWNNCRTEMINKIPNLINLIREDTIEIIKKENDITPKNMELTRSLNKGADLGIEEVLKELLMEQHSNELEGKGYDFYFSIKTKLEELLSTLSKGGEKE